MNKQMNKHMNTKHDNKKNFIFFLALGKSKKLHDCEIKMKLRIFACQEYLIQNKEKNKSKTKQKSKFRLGLGLVVLNIL